MKYEDLLKDKVNVHGRPQTGLKKKTMKPFWWFFKSFYDDIDHLKDDS